MMEKAEFAVANVPPSSDLHGGLIDRPTTRRGGAWVWDDLGPFAERQVRGDGDRGSPFAVGEDLEEQSPMTPARGT